MYIKSIKFKKDYRVFKASEVIPFSTFTILVGDQGSGKSSVFDLLINFSKLYRKIQDIIEIEYSGRPRFLFFDVEKQNPRILSGLMDDKAGLYQVQSLFKSHGETIKPMLNELLLEKEVVVLIDEPDSSLSPKSILDLIQNLKDSVNLNNNQVIISAHNPWLIESVDMVFDIEAKKLVNSIEYLKNIKESKNGK